MLSDTQLGNGKAHWSHISQLRAESLPLLPLREPQSQAGLSCSLKPEPEAPSCSVSEDLRRPLKGTIIGWLIGLVLRQDLTLASKPPASTSSAPHVCSRVCCHTPLSWLFKLLHSLLTLLHSRKKKKVTTESAIRQ